MGTRDQWAPEGDRCAFIKGGHGKVTTGGTREDRSRSEAGKGTGVRLDGRRGAGEAVEGPALRAVVFSGRLRRG